MVKAGLRTVPLGGFCDALQEGDMMQIKGLAAVVTGGGSGLGAATAAHLAALGCKVTVVDINHAAAEAHAAMIGGIGVACDVADAASAEAAFAAARAAHGPVRILVNCAGIATPGRIVGRDGPLKLEAFERVIRVNLIGTFNMLRLAAAEMSEADPLDEGERGVIVNTASVAGKIGAPLLAHYCASKFAVVGFTQSLAKEVAAQGIRVNCVCPGYVRTAMQERELEWEGRLRGADPAAIKAEYISLTPLGRLEEADDVADSVLFLASDLASFITGEAINVSGGAYMD